MSTIYKNVDVIILKPIRNLSNPIYSSTLNIRLSLEDILTCILEKATVLELLPNDEKLRLTLSNYKKDNVLGEEEPIPESNTSVGSFPFISNVLNDEGDAPYLLTGNAVRKYVSDHVGPDSNGVVTALDAGLFTSLTGATLKIRRGLKADLPILKLGEPAIALDEKRLYVGGSSDAAIAIPNKSDIDGLISIVDDIQDDVANKVDAVAGKGLSTNDYSNTDKLEVAKIANKADATVTAGLQSQITAMQNAISNLQALVSGGGGITPFSITGLTSSVTLAELGTTLNSINFNWTYSRTPLSQQFEGTSLDVALRSYNYTTPVTAAKTFTLSAVAPDGSTKTSTATVNFLNGIYYGVSPVATYDSTFIRSLTKVLSGTKSRTITLDAADVTDYIYYCIPSRLGVPVFVVGGFEGGITLETTIAFTNANGYTENYDIYRSDNSGLGSLTINIT